MTVTADDLRHALSWDEVATVVELVGPKGYIRLGPHFE